MTSISNSNMAGKNEVALDFNPPPVVPTPPGVKPERPADELVEMRFYIPQRGSGKKSRAGSQASGDEEDEEVDPDDAALDSDGNEISAAELFHKTIMDQAELGEQAGDAIASFVDVSVVTPRSVGKVVCRKDLLDADIGAFLFPGLVEDDTRSRCTRNICGCTEKRTTTRSCTSTSTDSSCYLERIKCTSNLSSVSLSLGQVQ